MCIICSVVISNFKHSMTDLLKKALDSLSVTPEEFFHHHYLACATVSDLQQLSPSHTDDVLKEGLAVL